MPAGRPKGSKDKRPRATANVIPTRGALRFRGLPPEEAAARRSAIAAMGAAAARAKREGKKEEVEAVAEDYFASQGITPHKLSIGDYQKLEKVKVDRARREALEMQNEEMARTRIPAEDFARRVDDVVRAFIARLETVTGVLYLCEDINEPALAFGRKLLLKWMVEGKAALLKELTYDLTDPPSPHYNGQDTPGEAPAAADAS